MKKNNVELSFQNLFLFGMCGYHLKKKDGIVTRRDLPINEIIEILNNNDMTTTKEILARGTKTENPVREINIQARPPWEADRQTLKNDLQYYKDETATLEIDVKNLETALYEKECEIEDLEDEIDELKIRLETFESLEP